MKFLSVLTVIFINSSFANYDYVEPSSEANQAADAFYNGEVLLIRNLGNK